MLKRIEILIVAMFAVVFGITMWTSFLRGRGTEVYDVEVIYAGAALIVYAIYYLMKQVWGRVRGVSHLSFYVESGTPL